MLYVVKIGIQFQGCCRIIAIVVDSLFLEFYYPNFVVYDLKKSSCIHPLVINVAFPEVVSFQGK